MSNPPRRRRGLLAAGLLLALLGCGDSFDPLEIYADGVTLEQVGVIHLAGSSRGDFVPGKLTASLNVPLAEAQVLSMVETRLPGASLTLQTGAQEGLELEVPEGISLADAAQRLSQESTVAEILPEFLPDASTAVSLRTTGGDFLFRSERLTYLVAEDQRSLIEFARAWVVKVQVRTAGPDVGITPEGSVQVLSIEKLAPYRFFLSGTLERIGDGSNCLVLRTTQGELVELAGSGAIGLVTALGTPSQVRLELSDLGLSTGSCAGGLQAMVLSFEAL